MGCRLTALCVRVRVSALSEHGVTADVCRAQQSTLVSSVANAGTGALLSNAGRRHVNTNNDGTQRISMPHAVKASIMVCRSGQLANALHTGCC